MHFYALFYTLFKIFYSIVDLCVLVNLNYGKKCCLFAMAIIFLFVKETDSRPLPTSKMDSFVAVVSALKLDLASSKDCKKH